MNKLILALDLDRGEDALGWVDKLGKTVGLFKIGMQLYNSAGSQILEAVQNRGAEVFVDLKFHDIPNTVAKASAVMAKRGAAMFTIHASGGYQMMAKAKEAVAKENPQTKVLAVSILTSMSQSVMNQEMGIPGSVEDRVVHYAQLAQKAGVDGLVCSPKEIELVRQACGSNLLLVTPGVRPLWAPADDQARVMTPGEAIALGADYLVIGRPIMAAENPQAAAERINEEIRGAVNEQK